MAPLPRMAPESRRRFNLADGLIVTAATAGTLALLKDVPEYPNLVWISGNFSRIGETPLVVQVAIRGTFLLIPWTIAVFLMRIRRPRPPLRRLVLQPGMAACGAVTLWLGFKALLLVSMMFGAPQKRQMLQMYLGDGVSIVSCAAPAVAGAWFVLACSGHWRTKGGWIDRLGVTIGVSWLVLELTNNLRLLF